MISIDRLKEYSKLKDYNLGQAEKDYYQEILLFILYKEFGQELVFKGGTALTKCYGFNRFSEDLDFNFRSNINLKEKIKNGLKSFYIELEMEDNRGIICRIKGPLYNGNRNSLCKIKIDLNRKEELVIKPIIKTIGLNIDEIPTFDVVVMAEKEILAEKVRTIYTRDSARDIFDMYFLLKRGVAIDINLINKKLEIYNLKFSKIFLDKVNDKKQIWVSEMKNLTKKFPEWEEVKAEIKQSFLKFIKREGVF